MSGITAYLESGIKSTYGRRILQHFCIQTWNFTKDRGTLQKIVELYKIPWNFTSPKYHLILAPQYTVDFVFKSIFYEFP